MKEVARTFFAVWYLFGWIAHLFMVTQSPNFYAGYGETALIPGFPALWRNMVMPNITLFAGLLMVFEIVVGVLIISKGTWVKLGLLASMAFNLFLVQMGLSSQANGLLEDFLINRLPNLAFLILQIPLLWVTFDRSIPEILTQKLGLKPKRV